MISEQITTKKMAIPWMLFTLASIELVQYFMHVGLSFFRRIWEINGPPLPSGFTTVKVQKPLLCAALGTVKIALNSSHLCQQISPL